MLVSLRELQLKAEQRFSVEDTRRDLTALTDFFCSLPIQEEALQKIAVNVRKLPLNIVKEQKLFFVPENFNVIDIPESLRSEALGMVKRDRIVYAGRLVYPVMDVRGEVMGFCGWDKFEENKYLDSRNDGYKAKHTTFYGMEKLPEYYGNSQPVYFVEGPVCCLYLRSVGMQAFSALTSHMSKYVIQILRRFGRRLVVIPDNDMVDKVGVDKLADNMTAGEGFVKQAKKCLPEARVVQSCIAKDVDDTRLLDGGIWEQDFLHELRHVVKNPFMPMKVLRIR